MTIYNILKYPHVLLKKKATLIDKFTDDLSLFSKNMIKTMLALDGIGLAAPQVGISKRIFVVDLSRQLNESKENEWSGNNKIFKNNEEIKLCFPLILINPVIVFSEKDIEFPYDGCLSLPGNNSLATIRKWKIILEAKDELLNDLRIESEGILSICLQHEFDHLEGTLFIERLIDKKSEADIIDDIKYEEKNKEYCRLIKKLKPVDARKTTWNFL